MSAAIFCPHCKLKYDKAVRLRRHRRLLDLLVLRGTLHRRNAGHGVRERRTVVSGKGQLP